MCELDDDGERASCWAVTTPCARKPHTCATCGLTIAVGEVHVRIFIAFDGRGRAERMCRACHGAQEEFGRAHGMTPGPSSTYETIAECVHGGVLDMKGHGCWGDPLTLAERRARAATAEPEERRWRQLLAGILSRARKARRISGTNSAATA